MLVRRLFPVVATLAAFVALAGCEEVLKQDELTASIKEEYAKQTGIKLTSLECDETKSEAGAKVSCQAANEKDISLDIEGEVTGRDKDTDKWLFSWDIVKAYAPGDFFEPTVLETINQKLGAGASAVECPDDIHLKAGNEINCEATLNDGSSRDVNMTLTDGNGAFRVTMS